MVFASKSVVNRFRDRQILNRDPGEIRDGQLIVAGAPAFPTVEDGAELDHVRFPDGTRAKGLCDLATQPTLLETVDDDQVG